jgi:hypothetical protein
LSAAERVVRCLESIRAPAARELPGSEAGLLALGRRLEAIEA